MPPDPSPEDQDEQYVSSQDSDFAPDEVVPGAISDDSDSDDAPVSGQGKHKQAGSGPRPQQEDDYDNSGDEAVISKGRKKRKRAQGRGQAADEDEGGSGGLVKTRAQRAAEKTERQYAARNDPVTIDVDALWVQMMSGEQPEPSSEDVTVSAATNGDSSAKASEQNKKDGLGDSSQPAPPDVIRIKRSYNFAGRVHTEEKVVARDSAEARLYLASQGEDAVSTDASPTKRATRKAFRSAFEPISDQGLGRTDLDLGLAARMRAGKEAQAKKLNTVEKSRMDWAGYVDKEGIQDELKLASKSKDSYAARQDFLARSEAIREDDARQARIAGRA